jgi:hemerythrin
LLIKKFDDRALNPTHDTISFLRTWLTDHIMKEDMAFAAFATSKQGGSADGARQKAKQTG